VQAVAVTVAGEVHHVPPGREKHIVAVLLEFTASPDGDTPAGEERAAGGRERACGSVRVPVRRHLQFEVDTSLVLRAPEGGWLVRVAASLEDTAEVLWPLLPPPSALMRVQLAA